MTGFAWHAHCAPMVTEVSTWLTSLKWKEFEMEVLNEVQICRICNKEECGNNGRTVCDSCMGLRGNEVQPPAELKHQYMCDLHGPHSGAIIANHHSIHCPVCINDKRRKSIIAARRREVLKELEAEHLDVKPPDIIPTMKQHPYPQEVIILKESDFAKRPGLYSSLCAIADEEERTPTQQCLYFLKSILAGSEGAA
jgi:hypothetical protein